MVPGDSSGLGVAITGGVGDIGSAIGLRLARAGARVTLLDRQPVEAARPVVERIQAACRGGVVEYLEVDVTDRARVERAVAAIDPLDAVIANAGIVESAPFLDITEEQWRRHLDVNLSGSFHTLQTSARVMTRRGTGGVIVLIGSWVGSVPWSEIAAYSATKAALEMLARSAARELAPLGVRVNVVAPGIVDAGLARHQVETEPQYARRVSGVIPLGELGTAEQVANAVAFLCSADAAYMTGSTLLVDGGCSLFKFD